MNNLDLSLLKSKDLRLLYVEDEKDTRNFTLALLNEIFTNIVIAFNGKDALEKFANAYHKNEKFDIILTDISMPYMDGISMSEKIKEIDSNIPIIVLTALKDTEILIKAIDIGIDSFINKPLNDIEILVNKIEKIIKNINFNILQKQEEKLNQEKEKIQLIFKMIHNLSHHWKQPLSTISIIASTYLYKMQNDISVDEQDLKKAQVILDEVNNLNEMIGQIENLNYDEITLKDIENIIYCYNPIY